MHILTGLLLGELLLGAKAVKGAARNGVPFEPTHVLPGRVRFRVPGIEGDAAQADTLARALSAVAGVSEVRVDARSGSCLVLFREEAEVRLAIIEALKGATAEHAGADAANHMASDAPGSLLRTRLAELAKSADDRVKEATHGAVDLKTLLGVAAGAWGVKTLVRPGTARRFSGLTLLFWSYNLLR